MSLASSSSFIFLLPCEFTRFADDQRPWLLLSATAFRPLESIGARRGGLRAAPFPRPASMTSSSVSEWSAASAHHRQAEVADERARYFRQLIRLQRIIPPRLRDFRDAGVRLAGERKRRVLGQAPQRIHHLAGTGRALSPITSAPQAAISAAADSGSVPRSMRPEGFERDLRDHWNAAARILDCLAGPEDLRSQLEEILGGLGDDAVDATLSSAPDCSRKISTSSAGRMRPRSGSLDEGRKPLGPSEPARTAGDRRRAGRGRPPRARSAPLSRSPPAPSRPDRTRPAWGGSRRTCWSRRRRSRSRGRSGALRRPRRGGSRKHLVAACRPSKSLTVRSPASCIRCSVVPMAPSKTTTPPAIASRRFLSGILEGAPYHAWHRDIGARSALRSP